MLFMLNRDLVPFGAIICRSFQTKIVGHGTKHKRSLVFPCLNHTLCSNKGVEFDLINVQYEAPVVYDESSIELSYKLSNFCFPKSSASPAASSHISMLQQTIQGQANELHYMRKLASSAPCPGVSLFSAPYNIPVDPHDVAMDPTRDLVVENSDADSEESFLDDSKESLAFQASALLCR